MTLPTAPTDTFDIIVVGAGISGINAAYRFQTELTDSKYTIIEGRGDVGGTWDLFRYPGVRNDSDMHDFGFEWNPFQEKKTIASGSSIQKYIRDSAKLHGIDNKIQCHRRMVAAAWSSDQQCWDLTVDFKGEVKHMYTRFIYLGTGYYDYSAAMPAHIPGLENFKGTTIHPQFWPQDLDYSEKKIVIIGSGATAITLLPVLVEKAAHVTMLQRSPSYIISQPSSDPMKEWLSRKFPSWTKFNHRIVRYQIIILTILFVRFCQKFPNKARGLLRNETIKELPSTMPHDPHFVPSYGHWDQRMCITADGDFFKAFHTGKADIMTGIVEEVRESGIQIKTADGTSSIDADIIITATGLKIQTAGGAHFTVDGTPTKIGDKFFWNGGMFQDMPNLAIGLGYDTFSWTLGTDATAMHIIRILKHMKRNRYTSAIPRLNNSETLKPLPCMKMRSTYFVQGTEEMPKCTDQNPWKPRSSYRHDFWQSRWGSITKGMEYVKKSS